MSIFSYLDFKVSAQIGSLPSPETSSIYKYLKILFGKSSWKVRWDDAFFSSTKLDSKRPSKVLMNIYITCWSFQMYVVKLFFGSQLPMKNLERSERHWAVKKKKHHLVGGWTTHLKNIRQIGSFPQVGLKITNPWTSHKMVHSNSNSSHLERLPKRGCQILLHPHPFSNWYNSGRVDSDWTLTEASFYGKAGPSYTVLNGVE